MAAKRRHKRPDELRREAQAEAREMGNKEQGQESSHVPGGKPASSMREERQRPGDPRRNR